VEGWAPTRIERTHTSARFVLLALATVFAMVAAPVSAVVPKADRVVAAVAKANRKAKRTTALRFELTLSIAGDVVAEGELVSHPTGLARLELRAPGGLVERHLLQGNQHSAARDGQMLAHPRRFVPPLFLLQANSPAVLDAALTTWQVDEGLVGLAPCGEGDCYVVGDPERVVARRRAIEVEVPDQPLNAAVDEGATEIPERSLEGGPIVAASGHGSIWVDSGSFDFRRIDSAAGVVVELGPYILSNKVRVPAWWSIEEPGKGVARFEIREVKEVNAPAAAFSRAWLLAPGPPSAPSDASTPSAPDGAPEPTEETPNPPSL
jgi:hypothetical protein